MGTKGPSLIIAKLEKPLWFIIDEILLSFVPFLKSCLTTFLLFFLAHLFSLFPSLLVSPNHFLPLFFPLPSSPFPPFASYSFPHPRYRPPKRPWKFREGASNLGPFGCIIGFFLDYQIYSILYIHETLCANWMNHWTHWVCYERIYSRAILDSWSFLKVYVVQMKHNLFATILLSKSEILFNFKYQYMWYLSVSNLLDFLVAN